MRTGDLLNGRVSATCAGVKWHTIKITQHETQPCLFAVQDGYGDEVGAGTKTCDDGADETANGHMPQFGALLAALAGFEGINLPDWP
jgi:hypothetical protein